jgi:hypothetical protein
MNNSKDTNKFISLPMVWSRRKDVSIYVKVIVAYIYTRSKAKLDSGDEWTISTADIVNNTAISKQVVNRAVKLLEKLAILTYSKTITREYRPFKTYTINVGGLKTYMGLSSPQRGASFPVGTKPPQLSSPADLSLVPRIDLEEDRIKEDTEKKIVKKCIEQPLGKLSPKGGDTLQPSKAEVVSINTPTITGHSVNSATNRTKTISGTLKPSELELIKKATANLVAPALAQGVEYRPSAKAIRQEMGRLRALGE